MRLAPAPVIRWTLPLLLAVSAAHAQSAGSRPTATAGVARPGAAVLAEARRYCVQNPPPPGGAQQLYRPPDWLLAGHTGHAPAPRNTGPIQHDPSVQEAVVAQMAVTDARRPDTLMRVAEAWIESAEARAVQGNAASVRAAQSHASALLAQIDRDHANYARGDAVLFHLARLSEAAGDMASARRYWLGLVQRYPMSPYVPRAYFSFGDYFFRQGEDASAEQFFSRATQFPASSNPLYGVALYYQAWTARHQHQEARAQQLFASVMEATGPSSVLPDAAVLHEKALRDFCTPAP
jgi:hypothetical protein